MNSRNDKENDMQWNYNTWNYKNLDSLNSEKYDRLGRNEKTGCSRQIGNIYRLIKRNIFVLYFFLIILLIFSINSLYDTEKISSVNYQESEVIGIKDTDTIVKIDFDYIDESFYYDNIEVDRGSSQIDKSKKNRNINTTKKLQDKKNRKTTKTNNPIKKTTPTPNENTVSSGFLVWSNECKIPNFDPEDPQVMQYFEKQKYESCSSKKPFTNVEFNTTTKQYQLNINETLKLKFGSSLDCCYQAIIRNQIGKNVDNKINLSECLPFDESVQISNTTDNILVKCNKENDENPEYIDGHPMMPERDEIRKRLNAWKMNETSRAPSILMIGIDSVSRLNLLRAMPKTAQKLYDHKWIEMSGYNKVDDNTFPNLMAILTGYNLTTVNTVCNPEELHKIDNCPLIWKLFQDYGYVTAYAEDASDISTFNLLSHGFGVPPVDYYLRPFMIAAEDNLKIGIKNDLKFCLGYQHSADYVYNYALELATRYRYEPFFGLFWANTFSHNDISDCSSMDTKMVKYLEELSTRGILNESVIIFFSDHGISYGPSRFLQSGYFEERLPFMFISLPQWLKTQYPEFVDGLSANMNRLINPYDIHMTLKHLLDVSGRTPTWSPPAKDCPNCQTLLKPVPHNRSCEVIGISDHWCTCVAYQSIDTKSDLIHKLAIFVVDYINDYIENFKNGSISKLCSKIQLHNITQAYIQKDLEEYRLLITTKPGDAIFEATIRHKTDTEDFQIIGSISRLNFYAKDSKCISYSDAKKYCHCSKKQKDLKTKALTTEMFFN